MTKGRGIFSVAVGEECISLLASNRLSGRGTLRDLEGEVDNMRSLTLKIDDEAYRRIKLLAQTWGLSLSQTAKNVLKYQFLLKQWETESKYKDCEIGMSE